MTNSLNEKHTDAEAEKFWQELKIDFRLEASLFPDNKVYGTIDIIPESSRKFIKKLVLVVNKSNRIEFESSYRHLAASGFNTNRKTPSIYIEAIPNKAERAEEPKISQTCSLYFTGEVFALSPTIEFSWSDENFHSKPILVVKWSHMGDKNAHKYILYLDEMEIQHIRRKLINDVFQVSIRGFEPGEKHTLQLAAKLNNGKETCRSDLMEFTVPSEKSTADESLEYITVLSEIPPSNLPAFIEINKDHKEKNPSQDRKEEDFKENQKRLLQEMEKQRLNSQSLSCCHHEPHEKFPGIEHYLNMTNILPTSRSRSFNIDKQIISSDEKKKEMNNDDDDKDVI